MKHLIDMAADRGAFICQSQSLNLWMEDPDYKTLTSMHFYAWEKGLKTGIYYLRRKAKHQAQQFTIVPTNKTGNDKEKKEEVEKRLTYNYRKLTPEQLEQKENIILQVEQEKDTLLQKAKREKQRAVEQAIIVQFPVNTECVYFGTIDNTNKEGEKLIKFGNTNDCKRYGGICSRN
jgi:hypothetical protein